MADTHETIADIIAEIRALSNTISDGIIAINGRSIADRLEAAHKRETVTGSNQLREALVKARRFIDSSPLASIVDDTGTIARGELCAEIDAALAAPETAEKSSAVGDAAKLREALKLCLRGMCGYCRMDAEARGMTTECVNGCEALLMAKAALAAPPRNCDIVPIEAREAADMFHRERPCHGYCYETHDWLLAPATEKEGGAK